MVAAVTEDDHGAGNDAERVDPALSASGPAVSGNWI